MLTDVDDSGSTAEEFLHVAETVEEVQRVGVAAAVRTHCLPQTMFLHRYNSLWTTFPLWTPVMVHVGAPREGEALTE